MRSRLAASAARLREVLPRAAPEDVAFPSRAPDDAGRAFAEEDTPSAAAATDMPGPGHQPASSRAGSTVRGTPKRRRAVEGGGGAGGALPQGAGVTATVGRPTDADAGRATMRPRTSPSASGGRTATVPRGGGRTVTTPRG